MKKLNILLALVALTASLSAQKIALHSTSGVQHFTGNTAFEMAYNASQGGDTIYLPGGSFNPLTFDKKLTIFGAGHYPGSTQATGKTFINGAITFGGNADQFHLEGVEITGTVTFTTNASINQVIIKRCKIIGSFNVLGNLSTPTSNLALIGNVFIGLVNLENAQNVFMSNNIFQSGLANTNGNLISNNIFLNHYYSCTWTVIAGNNNQINNNYFASTWVASCGTGNSFSHNLISGDGVNYGVNPTVTNSYLTVPMSSAFINSPTNLFDYSHNYNLNAPATYLGTDGTQVGIYGGTYPYKEGAVPSNPHIQLKNIAPTTDSNGMLNIQINVKAQNL